MTDSMKVSFTAGPWTAGPSRYQDGSYIVRAGMPSNRILARFGSDDEPLDEVDKANAHLIAATPDMFEACELMIAGKFDAACKKARAALSKVRGEP